MADPIKVKVSGEIDFDLSKPVGQRVVGSLSLHDSDLPVGGGIQKSASDNDIKKRQLEAWAKVIDVQIHFNEMSAKNRQLGLAFAAAALGLAIFLLNRPDANAGFLPFGWGVIHVSPLIVLGSALGVGAIWYLDIGHYHRLLRGAVAFGSSLERGLRDDIFSHGIGLTKFISHYSQYDYVNFHLPGEKGYPEKSNAESDSDFDARVAEYEEKKSKTLATARGRLMWFYGFVVAALVVIAISMLLALRQPVASRPQQSGQPLHTETSPVQSLPAN
jgi:hypothetical protein